MTAPRTIFHVLEGAPDDAEEARRRHGGLPWCDHCKRPAVFNEAVGYVHSSAEHPFGIPGDRPDHQVSVKAWWNTPNHLED